MKRLLSIGLIALMMLIGSGRINHASQSDDEFNRGIRNSEALAQILFTEADRDKENRGEILRTAASVSPNLPTVYFKLSAHSLCRGAILDAIDYFIQGFQSYCKNFWWEFTLSAAVFFSTFISFLLAAAATVLIRTPHDAPLVIHDIREKNIHILIFLLLMLSAIFSPLLFILNVLLFFSLYMKNLDRSVVASYILLIIISPVLLNKATFYVSTYSSPAISAIAEVNEARGNDYALDMLKGDRDFEAQFSYALALKRSGHYDDSLDIFKSLLAQRNDPRLLINLGNCYVGFYGLDEERKDILDESIKYYTQALEVSPSGIAYYNLSQIHREKFEFAKGDEYYTSAIEIDRAGVSDYDMALGRHANRIVVDGVLSNAEIMRYAGSMEQKPYSFRLSPAPVIVLPAIGLLCAGVFVFLLKKQKHRAFRCNKCGIIICTKCENQLTWGKMCSRCYNSLVKLDASDAKERVARIMSIQETLRRKRDIMKILSFLLPGSPFIYADMIFQGFLILWAFLFFLSLPIIIYIFQPGGLLYPHGIFKALGIVAAVSIYVVSFLYTRQRIISGWD